MSYLAVPEFHADQVSIHYHALVTFERKPKLHYKGRTKKGNRLYTFADDFKREDCFLAVEKLTNRQPIGYLTKYLTKTHDYPLYRRFMASRGLKRHRIIESCGGFNSAYGDVVMIKAVSARAMSCIWSKGKLATFSTRTRQRGGERRRGGLVYVLHKGRKNDRGVPLVLRPCRNTSGSRRKKQARSGRTPPKRYETRVTRVEVKPRA